VARRKAGETWLAIALAVGLSPSRVRRLYAAVVHPAPRLSPGAAALIANLRAFLAEAATTAAPTSRRAYGAWAGRLVSPATVVTRFGTWAHALALARMPERSLMQQRGDPSARACHNSKRPACREQAASEWHLDKACDAISDAILEAYRSDARLGTSR
jgi:hypothetical protein